MLSRREFIRSAALYAGLPGVAMTGAACAADVFLDLVKWTLTLLQ
jgi:hypothetical protein